MREKEFTNLKEIFPEGSFWGQDDMVKKSLDKDKKAGMIKFTKRDKAVIMVRPFIKVTKKESLN